MISKILTFGKQKYEFSKGTPGNIIISSHDACQNEYRECQMYSLRLQQWQVDLRPVLYI